jgi:hypothetical protein
VRAPVPHDHHACLRLPVPASPMLRCPPSSCRRDSLCSQHPPQGRPTQVHPVILGQALRHVLVIETPILSLRQCQHLLHRRCRRPSGRPPPPIPCVTVLRDTFANNRVRSTASRARSPPWSSSTTSVEPCGLSRKSHSTPTPSTRCRVTRLIARPVCSLACACPQVS